MTIYTVYFTPSKLLKQLYVNYSDNDLIEKQKYFEKFKHLLEI